jgi:hypothetical protein
MIHFSVVDFRHTSPSLSRPMCYSKPVINIQPSDFHLFRSVRRILDDDSFHAALFLIPASSAHVDWAEQPQ